MSLEGRYSPSTTTNKCEDSVKLQESLQIDKALGHLSWTDEMNLKTCQRSQATEGENSDPGVLSAVCQSIIWNLNISCLFKLLKSSLKHDSGLYLQCSSEFGQVDLFFL